MSNNQTDKSCRTNSWLAAIAVGILGFLLAWRGLEWGLVGSIALGAIVFFVIGYLMVRVICGKIIAAQSTQATPVARPVPAPLRNPSKATKPQKPSGLDRPRGGNADDLKKIKGIGPGLEKTLNENGIYHYDQIAVWTASDVAYVDNHMLRFQGRATRDGWVGQATSLASGDDGTVSNNEE